MPGELRERVVRPSVQIVTVEVAKMYPMLNKTASIRLCDQSIRNIFTNTTTFVTWHCVSKQPACDKNEAKRISENHNNGSKSYHTVRFYQEFDLVLKD